MTLRPPFDQSPQRQTAFTVTKESNMDEENKGFWNECREWWRLASVKLAAFVGLISSIVSANPDFLLTLAAIVPVATGPRLFFALGVGALVFAVPTITRIWPQSEKGE